MFRSLVAFVLLSSLPAMAGYTASSFKKDSRAGDGAFAIASALDSKLDTAWQCDPEKDNVGQWLEIDVPVGEVDKIGMVIGFDKNEDTFKDYVRVKSATVELFSKGMGAAKTKITEHKITFADERGWQIQDIPDTKIDGVLGGTVRITITEVYSGIDFPNLAVSEVRVHLKEFPAETMMLAEEPPAGADAKSLPAHLTDANEKTVYIAPGTTLSVKASAKGYGLASVGFVPGPATHARPKTVVLKANNNQVTTEIPEAAKGPQWVLLPAVVGYTGGAWGDVQIEVLDTWPGTVATNPLALAELKLNAATIEEF